MSFEDLPAKKPEITLGAHSGFGVRDCACESCDCLETGIAQCGRRVFPVLSGVCSANLSVNGLLH
jgi:hypothetical protein